MSVDYGLSTMVYFLWTIDYGLNKLIPRRHIIQHLHYFFYVFIR